MIGVFSLGIASGCSSNENSHKEMALDSKHAALPDFVLSTPAIVQETYVMAGEHPEALAAVPCYCNCFESAGHTSNLDCFVGELGPNDEVMNWDPHGTA